MNGKIAKRIRRAALIFSKARDYKATVKRLKKEYMVLPYHRRTDKPYRYKQSHSKMARMHHGLII